MQITVKDDSPDLDNGAVEVGDGYVRTDVDDNRYAEWAQFIRNNRAILTTGGGGGRWGRGSARDATEAESFSIGQLTYLEQKTFSRWYQPMRYEEILGPCIDYSAGPQAKAIDYLITDGVGVGRRMSPGSNDVPMVDVAYAKNTIAVASGGIGYDYTMEDIRTSAYLRQPLSNTKQVQSVLAYKRHLNKVLMQGETPSNFTGLYNNASVTAANRTSGAVWDSATADTIVSDIIAAYAAYRSATKGNEMPTKIIFPLTTRQLLYKPRATTSDTTIESFIKSTLNVDIADDDALETLGSGATKRVVFCNPTNDNIVCHIPMPIQFLAPQLSGYRVIVPAEYKYAGTEIRRVLSVRYMDGV